MQNIPNVQNFDLNRIPKEGSATFRADASYVWSTLPTVVEDIDSAITAINTLSSELKESAQQVAQDKNTVVEKEALINPHYSAIQTIHDNIEILNSVDANEENINLIVLSMNDIKNAGTNIQLAIDAKNKAQEIAQDVSNVLTTAKAEAELIIDSATNALPQGSINDLTSSKTTVYSSEEMENKLANQTSIAVAMAIVLG